MEFIPRMVVQIREHKIGCELYLCTQVFFPGWYFNFKSLRLDDHSGLKINQFRRLRFKYLFLKDLIDDWSVRSPPDLLYFVPYTWKFQFSFNDFELITLANEFNWIDTDTSSHEQVVFFKFKTLKVKIC